MGQSLWFISRATGTVSLVLLTVIAVLGIVTAGRRSPHGESATIVMALHRWLSLGMAAFLATHIVTAIADGYVDISWVATIVPFASAYATLWVALGTLAFDLFIAVLVTSIFRHRLRERTWRWVHWFTYAMWPVALVHGFALSTANEPLLRWTTVGCGVVALAAAAWRFTRTHDDASRRTAVNAQEWS